MTGMVEYTCPREFDGDSSGSFTLKNDPKATRFGSNNILFSGSKLYSDSMIGMVLFTGKYTRIFRCNQVNRLPIQSLMTKKRLSNKIKYPLFAIHLVWCCVVGAVYGLILFSDQESYSRAIIIEEASSLEFCVGKIFSVLIFGIGGIPVYLFTIADLCVALMAFGSELKFWDYLKNSIFSLLKIGKSTQGSSVASEDRSAADRMTVGQHSGDNEIHRSIDHIWTPTLNKKGNARIDNSSKKFFEDDLDLNEMGRPSFFNDSMAGQNDYAGNEVNHPLAHVASIVSNNTSPISRSVSLAPKPISLKDVPNISMMNFDLVLTASGVDHVVFDKTDTLTQGVMRIGKLTSRHRDYTFQVSDEQLKGMLEESKRNYVKYTISDSEDDMLFVGEEGYSEKSQE